MKRVSNAEIYDLKKLYSVTAKKRSRFDEDLTLEDVVTKRVDYVIEREVLQYPYISAVTIFNILRSNGAKWKNAKDLKLRSGLMEHAGIAQPPNWYLAEQAKRFGYIMDWPPSQLRDIITTTIRKNFINPILDGPSINSGYVVGYCKGYITEENGKSRYLPEYGKFISVYFFVNEKKMRSPELFKYISSQDNWFKKQWRMMLEKMPEMVRGWNRTAEKMALRSEAMRSIWSIDEDYKKSAFRDSLSPEIPVHMIDWRDKDSDIGDE